MTEICTSIWWVGLTIWFYFPQSQLKIIFINIRSSIIVFWLDITTLSLATTGILRGLLAEVSFLGPQSFRTGLCLMNSSHWWRLLRIFFLFDKVFILLYILKRKVAFLLDQLLFDKHLEDLLSFFFLDYLFFNSLFLSLVLLGDVDVLEVLLGQLLDRHVSDWALVLSLTSGSSHLIFNNIFYFKLERPVYHKFGKCKILTKKYIIDIIK